MPVTDNKISHCARNIKTEIKHPVGLKFVHGAGLPSYKPQKST